MENLLTFEDFVWRRYSIDLKGFSEEQLMDVKIQFILTFIDAPEINFGYWNTTFAGTWIKDPAKPIKIQYQKYMPISNSRVPKVHRNKFKRIFKTKKHV